MHRLPEQLPINGNFESERNARASYEYERLL